ncbi:MAG: hypothetical protein AB1792_08330 [Candidatus Zixiibacteriota bacterium]
MSSDTFLPIFGMALFLAGMATLLVLLVQIIRLARLGRREKRYRLIGWQSDLRRIVAVCVALMGILGGNLMFWLNGELRLYTPVYPGVPLGMVSVLRTGDRLPRLVCSTTDHEGRAAFEVFPVRDAKFQLRGERICWSRQFAALGMQDFFKVTQIQFLPAGATSDGPFGNRPTFSVNVTQGSTTLFARLRQWDRWLPFVRVDSLVTVPYDAAHEYSGSLFLDSVQLVLK